MPKQHQSKAMKQVLRELDRLGFTVNHKKSGSYTIIPPSDVDGPIYNTHGTESAIHPMRRDFKRLYNIELSIQGNNTFNWDQWQDQVVVLPLSQVSQQNFCWTTTNNTPFSSGDPYKMTFFYESIVGFHFFVYPKEGLNTQGGAPLAGGFPLSIFSTYISSIYIHTDRCFAGESHKNLNQL